MPFRGFEGPAGTGKTHQLVSAVVAHCRAQELAPHQQILALTFMHGARRRLDARLKIVPELRGRTTAMTIDSFAHTVWARWRTLAHRNSIEIGDFDETCDACGQLLEQPQVASWIARSYPIVIVDEAQELAAPRLRIIRALEAHAALFVAADEFQCLDENLDTTPFMSWFRTGDITQLRQVHRTAMSGLINAGVALRRLAPPQSGPGLQISSVYPNMMPFMIGAALAGGRGTRALLYPPGGGQWAIDLGARLAKGLRSKRFDIRPIKLAHHASPKEEGQVIARLFEGQIAYSLAEIEARFDALAVEPRWSSLARSALRLASRCTGKTQWSSAELSELFERKAAIERAYGAGRIEGVPTMSIHQAKNQQFQHVVVLWPHGVPGSDEFKARLLYNGITRAQSTCKVFVRTQTLLSQPPFRFG